MKKNLQFKHILSLAVMILLIMGGIKVTLAHDFTAVNEGKTIYYTITDAVNYYVAVAPNGTSTNSYEGVIVIPSTVTYNDIEYTVTSVAASAFKRSYEGATGGRITSVTLPNTIRSIGDNAFAYASTYLTSVNIPENVESIGKNAFDACKGLTSVTLHSSITSLGQQAFNACIGLTEINYNITSLSSGFPSKKGPFYGCSGDIVLTIGNNVTSIPSYAFEGANIIGTITIPDNVTTINTNAFNNITSYDKLIIGSGVTTLGGQAFSGCTGLTEIWVKPTTVPTCGYSLFYTVSRSILVYVPEGTSSSYHANMQWSDFTLTEYRELKTAVVIGKDEVYDMGDIYLVIGTGGSLTIADGGQLVCNNSVAATVQKTTTPTPETSKETTTVYNWYAISSPVNEVEIASFAHGSHNVYSYDEPTHYWHEYRSPLGSIPAFSKLDNGRGYLYRSDEANIAFSGNTNVTKAEYTLSYTPANEDKNIAGLNLIGNPFTHNIFKGDNTAIDSDDLEDGFYTLKEDGGWQAGNDNADAIAPTQGILVQAKSGANGNTLEITNTTAAAAKSGNDNIMFTVKNAKYSDVAYVLFKEGHGLNKIEHRNAEIPMLYVTKEGEDFAIADMADDTKVIYLGFEAKTMSQYTLSLKANGQYSYMHLYDKVAGEDIDMLVEDSYTFIGSPSDRKDRFTLNLTYDADIEEVEANTVFVYQNGNDIVVNGEGELHVFDMMGRMVMTTTVNGVETVNGLNNGVYVFRMGGKTQKVVVR